MATLAVNHVTTTGEKYQIGRVIIGQIHAKDDEPVRLYYGVALHHPTTGALPRLVDICEDSPSLPDATTVWPGHDYGCRPSSMIGLEKRTNPFLLCPDLPAFLELKAGWAEYKRVHGLV